VLLPGMDGTGQLFLDFVEFLPESIETVIVEYPTERFLSYAELDEFVRAACPVSTPFILLAESFSTPLAINHAASNPPNLIGLILCTGFATSPVQTWQRFLCSVFAPLIFRLPLPALAAKLWLVGPDAPSSLLKAVKTAIRLVRPAVLIARLRAVLACDARQQLTQVMVPVLYFQARQDRLVSASCLVELQRIMPQMKVTVLDGPHLLIQRRPQIVAEVVAEFAQRLP